MLRTEEAPFDSNDCRAIRRVIDGMAKACDIPCHLITAGFVDCHSGRPPRLSPGFAVWVGWGDVDLLTLMHEFWKNGR